MTALSVPMELRPVAEPRPLPWRQMAWVIWRQHRVALGAAGLLYGVTALYMWLTGLQLHHYYGAALACHPAFSFACSATAGRFNQTNSFLANGVLPALWPLLIGAFLGAPLFAREFESGTFRFTWTQGFGRWRWATAKLVGLGLLVTVSSGLMVFLFSWYYSPYFQTANQGHDLAQFSPYAAGLFELRGLSYVGWALVAFAIGSVLGLLIRRVVPAIVASLAAYGGLKALTIALLRQHYMAPLTSSKFNISPSAWILSSQWRTRGGRAVSNEALGRFLQEHLPRAAAGKGGVPQAYGPYRFLVQHGYVQWTSYQPVSRFAAFQWIEAGWLVALALALMAAAVVLLRRRAA